MPNSATIEGRPSPAAASTTPFLEARNLNKRFGGVQALKGVSFVIERGRTYHLMGENGCGKSTLINMISGILPYDAGQILFEGKEARDTRIGYVFQNYREAVFPWMRAIDNIRYPLQYLDIAKGERQARPVTRIASSDRRGGSVVP